MKIKTKELDPLLDALRLIAGFPLTINFAWKSAELRREVEGHIEIQDELKRKTFIECSDGEKDGQPIIKAGVQLQIYQDRLRELMDHEVEISDLNLTVENLKEYLGKKKEAEHTATIIYGLLPLLISE